VTCGVVNFTGNTEALNRATQKVHPVYEGCTIFGFAGTLINTVGCQYTFHTQPGTVILKAAPMEASSSKSTPGWASASRGFRTQTGINGQSFATGGTSPSRDITETSNATNIVAETTTATGLCPLTVGKDTGTYTGTTTVKAASGEIWYA
jgi:hypothetical protein